MVCCAGAAAVFSVYFALGVTAGGEDSPLMSLDDAYIHFQYARQIAGGQFYVYNPGLPPTSGATSFLYPYLLAFGHLIGFAGLRLGIWAMGLGALALALSAYLVYRLAVTWAVDRRWALFAPPIFMLHGLIAWHFMSGMETGIAILFTLLTIWALAERRHALALTAGALLALTRPEGAVLALLAVGMVFLRERRLSARLLLPMLALGAQPLVNLLATGSAVASGGSAKSLFGMIPFDLGVVIGRIADNLLRFWRDALIPSDALTPGIFTLGLLAAVGALRLWGRGRRLEMLILLGWMLAFALAVATLDTAFWHFRRYQMPALALLFPLAFAAAAGASRFGGLARALVVVSGLISVVHTAGGMARAYAVNVGYVRDQPLAMARWLSENTPLDAVIAVHDVGMMRYMGGRTTLDMVGLTTLGAADYWRSGPGAVGELIDRFRPDYIASYGVGHGLGLGYLEDTPLYGLPLAEFSVQLDPEINVALAADRQGIYQPIYLAADRSARPEGFASAYRLGDSLNRDQTQIVDRIDVADIQSERAHQYSWRNARPINGFPSEYYSLIALGCDIPLRCQIMDGGRRINGEEAFTVEAPSGQPLILITRVHPVDAGELDVYVNDALIGTRVVPALPGAFLEIPSRIPAEYVTDGRARVRIVPRVSGDYMPYYHWVMQGDPPGAPPPIAEAAAVYQGGAVELHQAVVSAAREPEAVWVQVSLLLGTRTGASGDYKLFIHLLDEGDRIAAQYDAYPGNGSLPPGNWLPTFFGEAITLRLPPEPGRYRVAFGLYNPYTFERLVPYKPDDSPAGDEQGRFIIGEVEIGGDG
jgi:hypothetical protein